MGSELTLNRALLSQGTSAGSPLPRTGSSHLSEMVVPGYLRIQPGLLMSFEYLDKNGALCSIIPLVRRRATVLTAIVLSAFLTLDSPLLAGVKHLTILCFRRTLGNSLACAELKG